MNHSGPILVCALLASMGLAQSASKRSAEELQHLVLEMADPDFSTREEATRELWLAGSEALGVLDPAAKDRKNPERMLRAMDIIRKIRLGLKPDTDEKVLSWAEQYETANINEKIRILGLMKGKRAWFPMLRLYAEESDPAHKKKLEATLEGVARYAARECIAAGEIERAFTALNLAPNDQKSLISKAALHRACGTLDAEWARLEEGEREGAWALAILRAKGDVSEARRVATLQEDATLTAWLAALDGDPMPWLQVMSQSTNRLETEYVRLATQKWLGEPMSEELLQAMVDRADGNLGTSRFAATQLLFLLARPEMAEPALADHSPLGSFLYFDSMEKTGKALAALGLDPEKPNYADWFADALVRYRKLDVENQHVVSDVGAEIISLTGFMERRGLGKELDEAFGGLFLKFADSEPFEFLDFLSRMIGTPHGNEGAPEFAARVASQWAGDDENRWTDVLANLLSDSDLGRVWWDCLAEEAPDLSLSERLRVFMVLFHLGSDPENIRAAWLDRLVRSSEKREDMVVNLHRLAVLTEDAELYGRVIDRVERAEQESVFWGMRMHFLSALGRWEDVVSVLKWHMARHEQGGRGYVPEIHLYAYLASALRLAGQGNEAETYDRLAETLYLGEGAFAMRIAEGYAYCGDYERALLWWQRSCIESGVEESGFTGSLESLASAYMERGDWLHAASLSECLLRLYANPNLRMETPAVFSQLRLQADTARALSRLSDDREGALDALEACHRAYISHGALADVFFPSLRKAGLIKEHDQWFDQTWKTMSDVIQRYPDSDNTRNTAAWIAARAVRGLDEAMIHIKAALAKRPNQAAYLDTMAEMQFALGNRKEAIRWSQKAMRAKPEDSIIRYQNSRFVNGPLPRR